MPIGTISQGEQAATSRSRARPISWMWSAVNSAELTLDTVVAVRDKVIAAYQSIMKMPI